MLLQHQRHRYPVILNLSVGQQGLEEQGAEEEDEEEEEEEELEVVQVSEREFNFLDYLKRCAPRGWSWCQGGDQGAMRMSYIFLTPASSRSLSRCSFANSTVLRAYLLLLRSYKQNSAHTNHCVVKMLHRLAHDLKMEALLFQLSLFYLFNRLLSDPAAGAYKVRKYQRMGVWRPRDVLG